MKVITGLLCAIYCLTLNAQQNKDCVRSLQIMATGQHHLEIQKGYGTTSELLVEDSAFKETNSIWIKLNIENLEPLEFTIIPDKKTDDLDFILYKGHDCTDMKPIRVMTSGEDFITNNDNCLGSIGLSSESYDQLEDIGCSMTNDNFLNSVPVSNIETYFLLVNNYDSTEGFSIIFPKTEGNSELANITVYPNPTSDRLSFSIIDDYATEDIYNIQVIDNLGRLIQTHHKISIKEDELNVAELPPGPYYLRLNGSTHTEVLSFVKK